ncbi:MAG: energy transducer TonB [candidate division WOR-3 bacterium]|nr:energy transducer TonB [candidate division WOR-3 bacterium]
MSDHKKMYGIYLRAGFLTAICMIIFLFLTIPYAEPEPYKLKHEIVGLINEITIEINKQAEPVNNETKPKPPPPVAPASDPQDGVSTINPTDLIENFIPTRPAGPEIEIVPYSKVEIKPQPVYMPAPDYPTLAIKAGIEGKTVVKMLVDVDGSVIAAEILKSSGNGMLDESALDAAKKSRFTPAKQRDRFVRVWVVRQYEFKLRGSS